MQEFLFKNINIIGLGLIGGSIAKGCKQYQVSQKVYGFDIDKSQIDFGLDNGIIDGVCNFKPLSDEDLIVIATPLSKYEEIFTTIKPLINDATIIDIGSLKEFSLIAAKKILGEKSANFIACHPIAGSDKSGIANGDENLFLNKKTIITLDQNTNKIKLKNIELFWERLGSTPEFIEAKEHDKIFALVSHLPQFLSFIAHEDFKNGDDEALNKHFRLQNSNPKIWQEIFKSNAQNIKHYLNIFLENLNSCAASYINDKNQSDESSNKAWQHRKIIVDSFLQIPDIVKFEKHAGTGFKDFTAISSQKEFSSKSSQNLSSFLHQIKSKIKNYEFK